MNTVLRYLEVCVTTMVPVST